MPEINKDPNNENLPEELQRALYELVQKYEREDSWVRRQQIKNWKKNDRFWHGIQFIFWSESQQDWLPLDFNRGTGELAAGGEAEDIFYDYVVNIYRAHGESIIAALSAQVPAVRFPPDDADSDEDLIASKTYAKVADLIQRHNPSKIILLRALFTLWNQGNVFSYHAPKADRAFGSYMFPTYEKALACEMCDFKPEDPEMTACPNCGSPLVEKPMITGFKESPKSRVLIELFDSLHVKVPYRARQQKEFGYLLCSLDQPEEFLKSVYPHVADKIGTQNRTEEGSYERLGRSPSTYSSSGADEGSGYLTLRRCWMRPWAFEHFSRDRPEIRDQLKSLFPTGVYCAFIDDVYTESRDENMDDYWNVCQAGLARFIHSDPIGQPMISVQELRNVFVNLTQETIEHGIPSGFADPTVLSFPTYGKHEARPGEIYPATPRPDKQLRDSFYETSRATLSQEVVGFGSQLDKDAQFVVGSFPSIYGGPGEGNSRTAAEYKMSRQMALQRLSILWAFITQWWIEMIGKCTKQFIDSMVEDERFVVLEDKHYVNVWIRRSELVGKVGEIEAEGADTFPVSTAQKQQIILNLLELNNEFINEALFDLENRRTIADAMSFTELHIPDEAQRVKQVQEINQILVGQPVEPEPLVDDHSIHIETLRNYMVSLKGLEDKLRRPEGYAALAEHLQKHVMLEQQMQVIQTPEEEVPEDGQS